MEQDKEARIRERAYEIWVREGRPHGRDAEHWQKAAAEISAESHAAADHAAAGSKPGSETPSAPPVAPGTPSSSAAPLRSRRAAKPAAGAPASGSGRRGRKASDT